MRDLMGDLWDWAVLAYRRRYWPNRRCQGCGHTLDEHWWQEPEFHCLMGWDLHVSPIVEGCLCGEFEGLDWHEVIEALES